MEASDMSDVIHFYFEEDSKYASAEQAESISKLRNQLYLMYNQIYKYGMSGSRSSRAYMPKGSSADYGFDDDGLGAVGESKPYIPPTDFNPESVNPFGPDLDAPLN
jgi:hypothetical protein